MDRTDLPPLRAHHWWTLLGIVAGGATLRFLALDRTPPGLWFDEGLNGLNALQILSGEFPLYFARHGLPQEPLHMYALALGVWLLGPTAFAIRAVSAVIGTLTLPIAFGCFREVFHANRPALIATAGLALMRWHVQFSRIGLRTIWVPLAAALVFWLALSTLRRPARWKAIALGLVLAFAMHTYLAARLLPFALLLLLAWDIHHRPWSIRHYRAAALALVFFLVGITPLAIHLTAHPDLLSGRVQDISMFSDGPSPDEWTPLGQGARGLHGVAENAFVSLWAFGLWGDPVAKHGLPGVAVFDPLTASLLFLGVLIALRRWSIRRGTTALLFWLGALLLASVLSFGAPNLLRTLGAAPAAIALVALGVDWIAGRTEVRWGRRAAWGLIAGWLAWFGTVETLRYHGEWAHLPRAWDEFSGREHEVASAIGSLPPGDTVAIFEGWEGHDAFTFLTHGRDFVLLPSESMILPPGERVHVFLLTELASQRDLAEQLRLFEAPQHRLNERFLATPAGHPFALWMTFEPTAEGAREE